MDGTDLNCINQVNNISLGENVSGQHSTVLNIACGIPQGPQRPALGPKSFALYTNDLPNAVTSGCALNTAAASNEDRFLPKLCCWLEDGTMTIWSDLLGETFSSFGRYYFWPAEYGGR